MRLNFRFEFEFRFTSGIGSKYTSRTSSHKCVSMNTGCSQILVERNSLSVAGLSVDPDEPKLCLLPLLALARSLAGPRSKVRVRVRMRVRVRARVCFAAVVAEAK